MKKMTNYALAAILIASFLLLSAPKHLSANNDVMTCSNSFTDTFSGTSLSSFWFEFPNFNTDTTSAEKYAPLNRKIEVDDVLKLQITGNNEGDVVAKIRSNDYYPDNTQIEVDVVSFPIIEGQNYRDMVMGFEDFKGYDAGSARIRIGEDETGRYLDMTAKNPENPEQLLSIRFSYDELQPKKLILQRKSKQVEGYVLTSENQIVKIGTLDLDTDAPARISLYYYPGHYTQPTAGIFDNFNVGCITDLNSIIPTTINPMTQDQSGTNEDKIFNTTEKQILIGVSGSILAILLLNFIVLILKKI